MKELKHILYFYETLLHVACENGNFELVKYLISLNKIDINSTNDIL